MKNVVFWDIKTQFVLHRRHITSLLQSPASYCYVRFEVFTAVTMKNVVYWDIKPQFLLHMRHITSTATESRQLILCKISGFHGSGYEECRLLRYKNPVCISQETHYVSATESSQLLLRFEVFTAVTMKNVVY
jgi:hypothetical protein